LLLVHGYIRMDIYDTASLITKLQSISSLQKLKLCPRVSDGRTVSLLNRRLITGSKLPVTEKQYGGIHIKIMNAKTTSTVFVVQNSLFLPSASYLTGNNSLKRPNNTI
jgi:hypothetical protein